MVGGGVGGMRGSQKSSTRNLLFSLVFKSFSESSKSTLSMNISTDKYILYILNYI